ncbi:hypothetical protein [Synechococcus sp. A15-28]|uniref:hypothetical protein n=1 Tax=Synechococcus sp. A15-28 TaxID=1050638 RepID=UPI0016454C46|nr:hypothetical protein [Synechococcus sp. A15-28]QNI43409.1 hypothetical protein SynA1528_02405 [Synechococcus sp. A15-28]
MSHSISTRLLLLLALTLPAQAAGPPPTWPSKDQLRAVKRAAFDCSRENSKETCDRARSLADPLMDHPLLPGVCKDVAWSLLEQARVAPTNDYKRRDAIDEPARRITRICAKPAKPKKAKPVAPTQS